MATAVGVTTKNVVIGSPFSFAQVYQVYLHKCTGYSFTYENLNMFFSFFSIFNLGLRVTSKYKRLTCHDLINTISSMATPVSVAITVSIFRFQQIVGTNPISR